MSSDHSAHPKYLSDGSADDRATVEHLAYRLGRASLGPAERGVEGRRRREGARRAADSEAADPFFEPPLRCRKESPRLL